MNKQKDQEIKMDSKEVKTLVEAIEAIASVLRGIEQSLDAILAEQREGK